MMKDNFIHLMKMERRTVFGLIHFSRCKQEIALRTMACLRRDEGTTSLRLFSYLQLHLREKMNKALNFLFRFCFKTCTKGAANSCIKGPKWTFEMREPKHKFRTGKPSRRGDRLKL